MFNKKLITPQTGPAGRKVRRLYLEEICDISKEFYLSCLIDRSSSKIAFISSAHGGVDIEEVAKSDPKKIVTIKIGLSKSVYEEDVKKIIKPFTLSEKSKKQAFLLVQSIYKILVFFPIIIALLPNPFVKLENLFKSSGIYQGI